MWGPLIEKAWAKSFSNYKAMARGGWSSQAMKAFNGAPAEQYYLGRFNPWDMFTRIHSGKAAGYFHNFETQKDPNGGGDTTVNQCGITYSHAFSLLDTF